MSHARKFGSLYRADLKNDLTLPEPFLFSIGIIGANFQESDSLRLRRLKFSANMKKDYIESIAMTVARKLVYDVVLDIFYQLCCFTSVKDCFLYIRQRISVKILQIPDRAWKRKISPSRLPKCMYIGPRNNGETSDSLMYPQ